MQIKPILRLTRTNNEHLLVLIKRVASMLDSNPFYSGLTNPTLAELNSIALDFENAISAWGNRYNHGSSTDKEALKAERFLVQQALRNVSNFCWSKTPNDRVALSSAGFELTQPRFRVGRLPRAENPRQYFSNTIPSGAVKIKWNRPLGIGKNAVKGYIVLHSLTPDPKTATYLALVTKASYLDLKAANRASNFYWVIPVGSAGDGVISDMVTGYPTGPVVTV